VDRNLNLIIKVFLLCLYVPFFLLIVAHDPNFFLLRMTRSPFFFFLEGAWLRCSYGVKWARESWSWDLVIKCRASSGPIGVVDESERAW